MYPHKIVLGLPLLPFGLSAFQEITVAANSSTTLDEGLVVYRYMKYF